MVMHDDDQQIIGCNDHYGMCDIVSHAHHVDVRSHGIPRTSIRYDVLSTGHDDI